MENDWYKGVARELSYFTLFEIIGAYNGMYERYKHTFFDTLFHMKNGIITFIRKKSEMKIMVDWIESLSEDYIVEQLQKAADLYDELSNALKDLKLDSESWKYIHSLSYELWAYYGFVTYFGYATEREKIKQIQEKNYDLVVKAKNEINNLQILDDFLKDYFKNIDLTGLSAEEIGDYLENGKLPSDEELEKRRGEFLIFMKNLKPVKIPKDKIQETLDKYSPEKDLSGINQVKGRIAFKANVSGPARLVSKREELHKIQNGDILVTIMTDPDFVPYLSKVVGIVTDYGGATCHASIIARELKIPCIVGTEIATSIFKDGDLIEMNEAGVVRKNQSNLSPKILKR